MSKSRIFTVGFELPGDDFEHVPFDSDRTLLDADIILFEPTLGNYYSGEDYSGKPLLSEHSSFRTKERLEHWHSEIITAVNSGKLVIIYLTKPIECFRYTGNKEYSGTGRSRVTTKIVAEISSYESVPNLDSVVAKSGESIQLDRNAVYIAPYWKEFSELSPYQVQIEGDFTRVLLKARSGERIVGASIHSKSGALLYLPPLQYDEEQFEEYDKQSEETRWTKKALRFGKKLATILADLAETLRKSAHFTPPPTWTGESKYRLDEENHLEKQISTLSAKITKLQGEKKVLEGKLQNVGSLRYLLYEQGKPLENALLEALGLFGFKASPFVDGESEFDVVFQSPEGRCLGEVEGKDNKAINIDKMSQLERNLQEDFTRDEVDEFAKGVLFGNAYRLDPIEKRGEFFTKKCVSAAMRGGIALVRTPDIFLPVKYLKQNPSDDEYAKKCREAIFKAVGTVVVFPNPPVQKEEIVVTNKSNDQKQNRA